MPRRTIQEAEVALTRLGATPGLAPGTYQQAQQELERQREQAREQAGKFLDTHVEGLERDRKKALDDLLQVRERRGQLADALRSGQLSPSDYRHEQGDLEGRRKRAENVLTRIERAAEEIEGYESDLDSYAGQLMQRHPHLRPTFDY